MPSISFMASRVLFARLYIVCRSSPNSFIAILARVPDSMASMRWVIGAPTSTIIPGTSCSLCLTSSSTSSFERSPSTNGASISDTFTPRACSSSSARPVFLPTVFISGIVSSSFSTRCPMRSDSSSDTPGSVLTFIVNEPSLNGGRKLRPSDRNSTIVTRTTAAAAPSMPRLWLSAAERAFE